MILRWVAKFLGLPGRCVCCGRKAGPMWCTDARHFVAVMRIQEGVCLLCFDAAARRRGDEILWRPVRMRRKL